jgi:hypothetical protein
MKDQIELTEEEYKSRIDALTHEQLAFKWRFAPCGDPLLTGNAGKYFTDRLFKHFGGITPELSKNMGWGEIIGA